MITGGHQEPGERQYRADPGMLIEPATLGSDTLTALERVVPIFPTYRC